MWGRWGMGGATERPVWAGCKAPKLLRKMAARGERVGQSDNFLMGHDAGAVV